MGGKLPKSVIIRNQLSGKTCITVAMLVFFIVLIFGCSSTTKIVLMPDPDGKIGVVETETIQGTQKLDQAWQATESSSLGEEPEAPVVMEEKEVRQTFSEALAALPAPPPPPPEPVKAEVAPPPVVPPPPPPPPPEPVTPVSFVVNFATNSDTLSKEALLMLDKVLEAIQSRKSTDIIVSGHTDTVASRAYNQRLSLKRARAVADFLIAKGIDRATINVTHHGKTKLLISTADGVSEVKNRRVEIIIR